MAKYEIAKLDVNSYSSYERSETYETAKEMFSRIKEMQENDNGWFYGNGSHILIDGERVATLHDYECMMMPVEDQFTGKEVTPSPSIKKLLNYVAETSGE